MPQARNTRLSRLAAGRAEAGAAAAAHRRALQARIAVCAMLRRALIEAGIDPCAIPALRLGGVASTELARLGEPPELPHADLAFDAGEAGILEERFAAKILMLARLRRDRSASDPASAPRYDFAAASLAELFCWHLLRPAPSQAAPQRLA